MTMESRPRAVITSKAAQDDIEHIKGIHADLMTDMAAHQVRVANIRQQNAQQAALNADRTREDGFRMQEIAAKRAPKL